jgi:FkbM family methyltransferase
MYLSGFNNEAKMFCIIFLLLFLPVCSLGNIFYSQSNQDKYIFEHFFPDKKEGFFVEIGAFDGVKYSNTYFFEQLGWHGICIEPVPWIYERLKTNRSCTCINGCITNISGTADFLIVDGPSIMLSGLMDKYDPRHLERIEFELASLGGAKKIIKIPCYTLNEILHKYGISHIDLLSIDVEGGELDILRSINFENVSVDVIVVENNYNDLAFRSFLKIKGYDFIIKLDGDEIFKKRKKNIPIKKII